jgi:hypothetical protein
LVPIAKTALSSNLETRGDRCYAGADVGDTIDDDHAVIAPADHAKATPCIAEPGHCAQDANTRRKERGRDWLADASLNRRIVEGERDVRHRR